jgi:hypothetical protein
MVFSCRGCGVSRHVPTGRSLADHSVPDQAVSSLVATSLRSGGVAASASRAIASSSGRTSCAAPPTRRSATVRVSVSLWPTIASTGACPQTVVAYLGVGDHLKLGGRTKPVGAPPPSPTTTPSSRRALPQPVKRPFGVQIRPIQRADKRRNVVKAPARPSRFPHIAAPTHPQLKRLRRLDESCLYSGQRKCGGFVKFNSEFYGPYRLWSMIPGRSPDRDVRCRVGCEQSGLRAHEQATADALVAPGRLSRPTSASRRHRRASRQAG